METLPTQPPLRRGLLFHQISVLIITFTAYASFHASRKPQTIVKPILASSDGEEIGGWAPFDGPNGAHRLGEVDLAFLATYAVGMYVAGNLADRMNIRILLAVGMIASAATTAAFGIAYWAKIHNLQFFIAVQISSGLVQSIGWPCVVAVVGNWFDKSKRGLIMGVWNSNTSVGNILGSVLASSVLEFGWGWAFLMPAILIGVVGVVVWAFLVVHPREVGFKSAETETESGIEMNAAGDEGVRESVEQLALLGSKEDVDSGSEEAAIGFLDAWRLPGVAQFAFCLFFSKLVAYTFLYWLPFYIRQNAVAGKQLSHKTAGILSTVFDIGGVLGGVSAGLISDRLDARAVTSILFLFFSIPALIVYRAYGGISMNLNIVLMFIAGYFVNGPYSLITTAVAADLGTQDTIKGNSRALATVTAIIDGTGSIGAALGPLLTGYISTRGWNSVFLMLISSTSLAITFLIQLAKAEISYKLSDVK